MTKTISITYNEADEDFILLLFKKIKIKVQQADTNKLLVDDDDDLIPERVAHDIIKALKDIKTGDANFSDAYEFLAEMRAEYPSKKAVV